MPPLLDEYRQYVPPAAGLSAPSSGSYGGLDLEAYLNNDPVLRAQLLGITGNVGSQLAGYDEQSRNALINYGEIPSGYDVDDVTRTAAQKATQGGYSTMAQLANAYARRNLASAGNLGARGIIRSGAFGANAMESQRLNNIAKAQALSALEAQRTGFAQQGLQAQQTGLGQRVTAEQDALDRLFTMIQSGIIGVPGTGGTGTGAAGQGAAPKLKPFPSVPGYNPNAYAQGGASPAVAQAIQGRGMQGPISTGAYNKHAYVPAGAAPNVQRTIQAQGASPSPFRAGLPAVDRYQLTPHGKALI